LSPQIEHALALQMHYTAMALVRHEDAAVARILRENNRFNDTLARIEVAAPPDERALIQQIRSAQDDAMAVVADIANAIREGKVEEALHALTTREDPLYRDIDGLVRQVVALEQARMASLRAGVTAAHRCSLFVMGGFAALARFSKASLRWPPQRKGKRRSTWSRRDARGRQRSPAPSRRSR
jgi:hypothetical protein